MALVHGPCPLCNEWVDFTPGSTLCDEPVPHDCKPVIGPQPYRCLSCGGICPSRHMPEVQAKKDALQFCFACLFWTEHVETRDDPRSVRVNGCHYRLGEETWSSADKALGGWGRGCGGSPHHVVFNDGRDVLTTNLWHQGTIPAIFRERLPDNAVFVYDEKTAVRYPYAGDPTQKAAR